jgi:hypothetical protein
VVTMTQAQRRGYSTLVQTSCGVSGKYTDSASLHSLY